MFSLGTLDVTAVNMEVDNGILPVTSNIALLFMRIVNNYNVTLHNTHVGDLVLHNPVYGQPETLYYQLSSEALFDRAVSEMVQLFGIMNNHGITDAEKKAILRKLALIIITAATCMVYSVF